MWVGGGLASVFWFWVLLFLCLGLVEWLAGLLRSVSLVVYGVGLVFMVVWIPGSAVLLGSWVWLGFLFWW